MEDIQRLFRKLELLQYPTKAPNVEEYLITKRKEIAFLQFNCEKIFDGKWCEELKQLGWYNRSEVRNKIFYLIKQGKIAPLCERSEEICTDNEHSCMLCMSKPKDKRVGFNWVHCSNCTSNHLICTACLIEVFDNECRQAGSDISKPYKWKCDLDHLKYYCDFCRKDSNLTYLEPSAEELLKGTSPKDFNYKTVFGRRGIEFNSN